MTTLILYLIIWLVLGYFGISLFKYTDVKLSNILKTTPTEVTNSGMLLGFISGPVLLAISFLGFLWLLVITGFNKTNYSKWFKEKFKIRQDLLVINLVILIVCIILLGVRING